MVVSGTCIVAIRTSEELVVGADSSSNVRDEEPTLVCKIGVVGDIAFSTAGLAKVFNDETQRVHLEVREKVQDSIDPFFSVSTNLDHIVMALGAEAAAYYRSASEGDRMSFFIGLTQVPIEVGLYRYEDDALKLSVRRLVLLSINGLSFGYAVPAYRSFPALPGADWYLAGSYASIVRHYESRPLESNTNLVNVVRDSIQIEIAACPEFVREPIRIIRLTKSQITWEM